MPTHVKSAARLDQARVNLGLGSLDRIGPASKRARATLGAAVVHPGSLGRPLALVDLVVGAHEAAAHVLAERALLLAVGIAELLFQARFSVDAPAVIDPAFSAPVVAPAPFKFA